MTTITREELNEINAAIKADEKQLKKPISAYQYYMKAMREKWKSLSQDEANEFHMKSDSDAERYRSEREKIRERHSDKILSKNISKEEKMSELETIAKETVDIKGIGFYSLWSIRKELDDNQKKKYSKLFEGYFLKSFSSRLAEYTNPEIEVNGKKILNKNYTIVNSILLGTSERPEVKIDWRIYTKNPSNPLIRDLIIEGLSLARTQKEEFASVLSSNDSNINVLFKTLEEFSKN